MSSRRSFNTLSTYHWECLRDQNLIFYDICVKGRINLISADGEKFCVGVAK